MDSISFIGQLTKGTQALADGSVQLEKGSKKLTDATGILRQKTTGMNHEAAQTIEGMLSELRGNSGHAKSFVSDKNTNVMGVQFVMKNKAIEMPKQDPPEESQKAEQSLWQKFLALFQ